jgi:hypothetical protein
MSGQTRTHTRTAQHTAEREKLRKAVFRYIDGSILRGYVSSDDLEMIGKDESVSFPAKTTDGQAHEAWATALKAVFLVKTFEGSRDYSEFKVFSNQPNGKGVWVRVHFLDGEIIEGIAPNSLDTYAKPVFFLVPPDPGSNNQAVLVSKCSLREMHILGLATE